MSNIISERVMRDPAAGVDCSRGVMLCFREQTRQATFVVLNPAERQAHGPEAGQEIQTLSVTSKGPAELGSRAAFCHNTGSG